MCRKVRPGRNRARKKDFSFSDKLRESGFGRLQGKTRPGVQQAQTFAHHLASIAGASPPVTGLVRVAPGAAAWGGGEGRRRWRTGMAAVFWGGSSLASKGARLRKASRSRKRNEPMIESQRRGLRASVLGRIVANIISIKKVYAAK